jgi:hypothetical protein
MTYKSKAEYFNANKECIVESFNEYCTDPTHPNIITLDEFIQACWEVEQDTSNIPHNKTV